LQHAWQWHFAVVNPVGIATMNNKVFPFYLYFLLANIAPIFCISAQDTITLNLQVAVDRAIEGNSDIAVAAYRLNSAEYAVKESKGNFLPKATLNGSYTRNIDKPVIFLPEGLGPGGATAIGSDNNFSTGIDISVPLYSKNNSSTEKYAQASFELSSEVLKGTRQQVTVNVKKSYFFCVVARRVVEVRERSLTNAQESLQNIQDRLAHGVATEFDQASARVKVTIARNNLLEARNQTISLENNLKLLLGIPPQTVLNLLDSVAEASVGLTQPGDELSLNSNLRQKKLQVMAYQQQTLMARAAYYPFFSAFANYQFQSQENDLDISSYKWVRTSAVGLKLQVPLFNGLVTHNKVQQAVIAEKVAQAQEEYTDRANRMQLMQLANDIELARQRITLQTENIDVASKAHALAKERFSYGKSTLLEVDNAELEYTTAHLSYLQAVMAYLSAYYDLELLTGKIN
jgi:outer membrane protein